MFGKQQVNLFRDEALSKVPDSTPQAMTKHRNACVCVCVCVHVLLFSENS